MNLAILKLNFGAGNKIKIQEKNVRKIRKIKCLNKKQ